MSTNEIDIVNIGEHHLNYHSNLAVDINNTVPIVDIFMMINMFNSNKD